MPRYRRPNYRNNRGNEQGIHVAELVENSDEMNQLGEIYDDLLRSEEAKKNRNLRQN